MILVKTRKVDGKTEYLCPICEVYVPGVLINVTGYTEVACSGCGSTLDDDYFDNMEWENRHAQGNDDSEFS